MIDQVRRLSDQGIIVIGHCGERRFHTLFANFLRDASHAVGQQSRGVTFFGRSVGA